MAQRRFERTPGQFVTLAMDDDPPVGMSLWAIVRARLLDDTTGEPVRALVVITIEQRGLTPRIVADGLIALAGRPLTLFPNLAAQGCSVAFTVFATGYRPLRVVTPIPRTRDFPNTFETVNQGDIRLHPA